IQLRAIIVPMQNAAVLSSVFRLPRGLAATLLAALVSARSAKARSRLPASLGDGPAVYSVVLRAWTADTIHVGTGGAATSLVGSPTHRNRSNTAPGATVQPPSPRQSTPAGSVPVRLPSRSPSACLK